MRKHEFENLTDLELATKAYLTILSADDELPDNSKVDEGVRMLGVLIDRLRGPYCEAEGCEELRLPSFPWCRDSAHKEAIFRQREQMS